MLLWIKLVRIWNRGKAEFNLLFFNLMLKSENVPRIQGFEDGRSDDPGFGLNGFEPP
jgi:hypothetical protein